MRYVFWQNIPSLHQSAVIRALAEQYDKEIVLVTESDVPAWRISMGWQRPVFGKARIVISPTGGDLKEIVAASTQETVHIFSGITSYSMIKQAFLMIAKTDACIGILSEAGSWQGITGRLRLIRGRLEAMRFAKRVSFVLAIGSLGVTWFKRIGYSPAQIFPYGYFVEKPQLDIDDGSAGMPTMLKIIYVGQLIERKGVDLLIESLSRLTATNWCLKVIGDGPERASLEKMSRRLGVARQIVFDGLRSNRYVMQTIFRSDLLVLPSRWDGWGAVINEALMQGVPVICSDRCGSADLITTPQNGEVFKAGSVESLREALQRRLEQGPRTEALTQAIRDWSERITGDSAARYFRQIVDAATSHQIHPAPPWKE